MNLNYCIFYNPVILYCIRSIIFKTMIVKCYIYNYYSIFSCSYTKCNLVWKTRRNPEDDLIVKKKEKKVYYPLSTFRQWIDGNTPAQSMSVTYSCVCTCPRRAPLSTPLVARGIMPIHSGIMTS